MSEFDKEAEREKLREKFAKDEEKRQSTKRMSELLLKGATMTNRHCNNCGDPVFRFDGQEFCPSCQDAEVAGGQIRLRNPSGRQESPAEQPPEAAESTAAADEPTAQTATDPSQSAPERAETAPQTRDGDDADVEPTQPPVPATDESEASTATPTTEPRAPATSTSTADAGSTGDGADLDAARASLCRTVTRYAEAAEQTDDPRRARELLAAAHEAAETLAALRR
jgi:uncharacterized Zn finger protein (UPF0148 family)